MAAGTTQPVRSWLGLPDRAEERRTERQWDAAWQRTVAPGMRHAAEVLRVLDGDTFEARVRLSPGLETVTRVRLRGIDAAERDAACNEEERLAAAATAALRRLLAEGDVTIFNVGPDKYPGRIVADAATRRTPDISAALLGTGVVRAYEGGRRRGWCDSASR